MSLRPSGSKTHERLPSPPPSPLEEDLEGRWLNSGEDEHHRQGSPDGPSSSKWKGKGRESYDITEDIISGEDAEADPVAAGYPPVHDEEEQSRKVEENLKRWERAERQKRKAARGSAAMGSQSSIVEGVGRRASLLWSGSKPKRMSHKSMSGHKALDTQEPDDSVPLDNIEGKDGILTPTPSAPSSPHPTAFDDHHSNGPPPVDNPFDSPVRENPFHDPQHSAVMDGSSLPPTPATRLEKRAAARAATTDRAVLQASSSFSKPPPPKPLDIPPPRTPPPRVMTPGVSHQPEPVTPPATSSSTEPEDARPRETRWWTDWLCGCREGPDRGGDNQAGRTNPFE